MSFGYFELFICTKCQIHRQISYKAESSAPQPHCIPNTLNLFPDWEEKGQKIAVIFDLRSSRNNLHKTLQRVVNVCNWCASAAVISVSGFKAAGCGVIWIKSHTCSHTYTTTGPDSDVIRGKNSHTVLTVNKSAPGPCLPPDSVYSHWVSGYPACVCLCSAYLSAAVGVLSLCWP